MFSIFWGVKAHIKSYKFILTPEFRDPKTSTTSRPQLAQRAPPAGTERWLLGTEARP